MPVIDAASTAAAAAAAPLSRSASDIALDDLISDDEDPAVKAFKDFDEAGGYYGTTIDSEDDADNEAAFGCCSIEPSESPLANSNVSAA
jgi:hypothetical protein